MKKKNRILILPLVLIGVLLMLTESCKKDETNTPIITNKTGAIIVSNSYSKTGSSVYIYYLTSIQVSLYRSGTLISTQNTTPNSSLNMGVYDYGTYNVQLLSYENKTEIKTGASSYSTSYNNSQTYDLNAPTLTFTFKIFP